MGPKIKKKFDNERGQSMVIFAVALVGLLAFVALAADTGQLYVERRNAQSAADSAAFAAASAKIKGSNIQTAGLNVASANGFNNDGVTNTVSVYNPPQTAGYDNSFVEVVISSRVDTSFLHLFGRDSIVNTSSAIVQAKTNIPAFGGDALVATDDEGCDTLRTEGKISAVIEKGNIFVNSKGSTGKKADGTCGFDTKGNAGSITVSDGAVRTVGTGIADKHNIVSASDGIAVNQTKEDFINIIPVPDCGLKSNFSNAASYDINKTYTSGDATLSPGVYDSINAGQADIYFNPGLYCIKGNFTGKGTFTGNGVLFVMQGGIFDMTGGKGNATLSAQSNPFPLTTVDGDVVDYQGMLFMSGDYDAAHNYYSTSSLASFDFQGNSSAFFTGTIYLPEVDCGLGGTPDIGPVHSEMKTQMICYNVLLHGNSTIYLSLDSDAVFHSGGSLDLMQ